MMVQYKEKRPILSQWNRDKFKQASANCHPERSEGS